MQTRKRITYNPCITSINVTRSGRSLSHLGRCLRLEVLFASQPAARYNGSLNTCAMIEGINRKTFEGPKVTQKPFKVSPRLHLGLWHLPSLRGTVLRLPCDKREPEAPTQSLRKRSTWLQSAGEKT